MDNEKIFSIPEDFLSNVPNIVSADLSYRETLLSSLEEANRENRARARLQDEANRTTIENKEILLEIAENTAYLKTLVEINRETQLNGEELNYIMRAIYNVAKASDKEDADNLFKEALGVINDSGEAAGNIANLISFLHGLYTVVITFF